MCLDIDVRYHPKYGKKGQAFVAQQPILVYKRLEKCDKDGGRAPYRGTRWNFGVPMTVPHFTYSGGMLHRVEAGLHSFFTKEARRCYGGRVFPAVIPVGARFFIGNEGEVVSTSLTVYRNQTEMLAAFGAKKIGPAIRRHTLTKRAS